MSLIVLNGSAIFLINQMPACVTHIPHVPSPHLVKPPLRWPSSSLNVLLKYVGWSSEDTRDFLCPLPRPFPSSSWWTLKLVCDLRTVALPRNLKNNLKLRATFSPPPPPLQGDVPNQHAHRLTGRPQHPYTTRKAAPVARKLSRRLLFLFCTIFSTLDFMLAGFFCEITIFLRS